MYTAFLRWGEAASHASSFYESDEEGGIRSASAAEARAAVSRIAAENLHDMAFVMLLAGIETADAPTFGPLNRCFADFDVNGGDLLRRICLDLRKFSPIPDLVNEVSARAWKASKSKSAISADIGLAITSSFSFARGEDVPATGINGHGCAFGRLQREWRSAYAAFQDADAAMNAYDRDHMTPLDGDYPEGMQEHYDDLVDVCYQARVNLYLTPAPSVTELAIKLDMFAIHDDKALVRANEIIRELASDAMRLNSSEPVLFAVRYPSGWAETATDAALLAAFMAGRHEFEAADKGPWTAEQEDAYFARVDAAEMVLLDTRAATLEGVIAKLRVAFMNRDAADWSDLAISNTIDPKFIYGLRMSGMYERLAWGAIEDLARIAGVSLAEQGA